MASSLDYAANSLVVHHNPPSAPTTLLPHPLPPHPVPVAPQPVAMKFPRGARIRIFFSQLTKLFNKTPYPRATLTTLTTTSSLEVKPDIDSWRDHSSSSSFPTSVQNQLHTSSDVCLPAPCTQQLPDTLEQQQVADPAATASSTGTKQCKQPQFVLWRPFRFIGTQLRTAFSFVVHHIGPQGPGTNDKTLVEKVLNVATCIPFFCVGGNVLRLCRTAALRQFGWAFLGVGVAASVYHASSGKLRHLTRKADYWTIAYASCVLRGLAYGPQSTLVRAATALVLPFKPSFVSTGNFLLTEVKYARVAQLCPVMAKQWASHMGLIAAAGAAFTLEDVLPQVPIMHAAWHTLAACGFLSFGGFLAHLDKLHVTRGLVTA